MLFDYLLLAQIDHRRAYNCEIMLSKVKVPLQDLMVRWFIFVYLSMKLRKKICFNYLIIIVTRSVTTK